MERVLVEEDRELIVVVVEFECLEDGVVEEVEAEFVARAEQDNVGSLE